nr:N-acetylglucosamine-specific PTS transporter subunit IIBC [Rhizomicrobium palustre]
MGRALMLPIAVLPAAGILLRIGQPDLLNIAFIASAGAAIFQNLGLLFALGIAVGLAKENHGAAALAGAVFFLVATTGAKALMLVPPSELTGLSGTALSLAAEHFKDSQLAKLGVPTGILSGFVAGWLYNRFHTIRLPEYLAFFAGRRFVPIAAGFLALIPAFIIGTLWPSISQAMDSASHAVLSLGSVGLFIYGTLNRLLIVTGLHHILNNLAWFNLGSYHGVTGDLNRFFAGDPSAGAFMSGFFPVMMFGLPAACLAMYHTARPERRKEVGGMLASMALTAFLTGVTEPIEFSFMFLAPPLYVLHALLTGFSMVLMNILGVHLGFGFSAGLFDYVINYTKAQKAWLLLPVGLVYFALYYSVFRFAIQRFNLKTLGRDDAPATTLQAAATDRGAAYLTALGGADNLTAVDACTTRLRLSVKSNTGIDEASLRALGAKGFVRPSPTALQVVIGPEADQIASEIKAAIGKPLASIPLEKPSPSVVSTSLPVGAVLAGLGGAGNVKALTLCASRIVVELADSRLSDAGVLRRAGIRSLARGAQSLHLIIGPEAEGVFAALKAGRV